MYSPIKQQYLGCCSEDEVHLVEKCAESEMWLMETAADGRYIFKSKLHNLYLSYSDAGDVNGKL